MIASLKPADLSWPIAAFVLQSFLTVIVVYIQTLIKNKNDKTTAATQPSGAQPHFHPESSQPGNAWCPCATGFSSHPLRLCPALAPPACALQAPVVFLRHFLESRSFTQGQEPGASSGFDRCRPWRDHKHMSAALSVGPTACVVPRDGSFRTLPRTVESSAL